MTCPFCTLPLTCTQGATEGNLHIFYEPTVPLCHTHAHLFSNYDAHAANLKRTLGLDEELPAVGEDGAVESAVETRLQKMRLVYRGTRLLALLRRVMFGGESSEDDCTPLALRVCD